MKIRVADYIVNRLHQAGVDTIFLLNGGGMMHLVDAVGNHKGIKVVCNHHEQASAIAADGYARLSGSLGACFATSGPGATNILTGLVGAWQDSSRVIFVTGQSKITQTIANSNIKGLRQFGTFEVDIVPIVKSVTKYSHMIIEPRSIRYHLEKALYHISSGRPGPALLDIPLDIQGSLIDPEELDGFSPPDTELMSSSDDMQKVLSLLANSARPVLLAGNGINISGSSLLFREFVDRLKIPIVTTQLGKDILHYDHPMFVGHGGPKGDRAGNFALQTADLIISLGCSLHSQTTGWENDLFSPDAFKVQVDVDSSLFEREDIGVSLKINLPINEFIGLLYPLVVEHYSNDWRLLCLDWKSRYPVNNEPHKIVPSTINFYHFIHELSKQLSNDVCITSDSGSSFYVTGHALLMKDGQRFISSGSLGAMGFALPAACGAAFVDSKIATVCITGDGSLMTNLHELATVSYHELNMKIFIINNNGYVSMRNTQQAFFSGELVASDESSGVFIPSIKVISETFKIDHVLCAGNENIQSVISDVLERKGPVICEVVCQQDQIIMPSVASKRLPDGRMISAPLHEMAPSLSDKVLREEIGRANAIT
jgi:acetolactate synthase I/II/III large subunit